MRRTTIYLFVLGVAVAITAMASTNLVVSAQNSNMAAANTSKPKAKTHKKKAMGKRCDSMQQEQTDLSGTYTGKAKHGDEAAVDATLTITGNDFTMTSGSETHSGRVTAVTTCGYTAVTMMMGNMAAPATNSAPPPNPAMSLRAKKSGNNLTLTSVPGEPKSLWFSTSGSGMKPKPKKHKAKPKTDTSKPAAPPAKK